MSDKKGIKRKVFTISEKAEIIKQIKNGKSKSAVAHIFNLPNSTVHTIWNSRDKILTAFEKNQSKAKKIRGPQLSDVDQALLKWFQQQRALNLPISGPILKIKAEILAKHLGVENFVCSNGWLTRFKERHRICTGRICGEAKSCDSNALEEWLEKVWPELRENYCDEDIFNADETGLFYKALPNKLLRFKNEKCVGGKLSEERLTILCCANMTGSEKRKLMVIGKSQKPRCFKNVRNMPNVNYYANKKAWMTADFFEQEIKNWDRELQTKKRNILLIIDNCPAHPDISLKLSRIKLVFLPPNVTAVLQPMGQGIIQNLKSNYRKNILLETIECLEKDKPITITVLDAIRQIETAWHNVTQKTIENCFSYAGFKPVVKEELEYAEQDLIPLANLRILLKNSAQLQNFNFHEFVAIDDEVLTYEVHTDESIVAEIKNKNNVSECEDDNTEESETPVTVLDALTAARYLERCAGSFADNAIFQNVVRVREHFQKLYLTRKMDQFQIS